MIYAFGSNGSGQLGIGHREDTSSPQALTWQNPAKVKKIVAGGNHTVVLLETGQVFAAGHNEDGRCGDGDSTSEMQYLADGVHDISATWTATFLVKADAIYACGTGERGELGLGPDVTVSKKPQAITLGNVKQIASGVSHTIVVLEDNQVIGWGRGRKGQLGEPAKDQWSPRPLPLAASTAVVGSEFTCLVGESILVLGSDRRDRFRLRAGRPNLAPYVSILASWNTAYILQPDGKLVAWGRDDRGQIPKNLPPIVDFTAGSEHWLALSTSGDILTGGWGEHGNCGPDTDTHGVVHGYNTIAVPFKPTAVFAGCATSFIID